MFWNKKSAADSLQHPSLQELASRLGVERRTNVRVFYPERTTATLPTISFAGNRMRVKDLSVGGCCLIDIHETLGSSVGNELLLSVKFPDGADEVRARIVGRIDDRRNVQFLDLKADRQKQIKDLMTYGIRGLGIKAGLKTVEKGPSLAASEIWNAPNGDALIVEDGVHRLAQAEINSELFYFYRSAWPVDRNLKAVPTQTLNQLILFIANIGYPSSAVASLLSQLEDLALEACP
jgi:hypothetical protein